MIILKDFTKKKNDYIKKEPTEANTTTAIKAKLKTKNTGRLKTTATNNPTSNNQHQGENNYIGVLRS